MKKLIQLFIPVILLGTLSGCFSNQEKDSLNQLVEKSPLYMDRDGKTDELIIRSDMTFDYHHITNYYEHLTDVENGTIELITTGSYGYSGNWGYKGTAKYCVYQMKELSYQMLDGDQNYSYHFYFVNHDGLFYSYVRREPPQQEDIKNGLTGVRWYPQKSN